MAITVYFANIAKRRNSTLQGTFSISFDCTLKSECSVDRPTFLVSAASMPYNVAKWDDRYYFIDDIVSVRAGQWEVSCVLDVLATYKADILASTQYVCYSSQLGDTWLPDTRIPVKRSETSDFESVGIEASKNPFNSVGFFALSATGKDGTELYALTKSEVDSLIARINNWSDDLVNGINDGTLFNLNYQFGTPQEAIESMAYILTQTGVLGNAFANAPQNIRSCIWLPLSKSKFSTAGDSTPTSKRLYLGSFDTQLDLPLVKIPPVADLLTIDIPWQHSDWRRSLCESLILYLPFAGCVNLPVDLICNETQIKIRYSITACDGIVTYLVYAGNDNIIGTYGGSLAGNYAIGINQQASLGEVTQAAYDGAERVAAAAANTTLSPMSIIGGVANTALTGIDAALDVADVALSTHPTTIGSFGGCAGIGLTAGTFFLCSVAHDTIVSPATMAATMGRPTMKPLSLATLTGYCQCANAHVAAAAQASELDAIDFYLNSGFYIE